MGVHALCICMLQAVLISMGIKSLLLHIPSAIITNIITTIDSPTSTSTTYSSPSFTPTTSTSPT